jgi:hypothetical protein
MTEMLAVLFKQMVTKEKRKEDKQVLQPLQWAQQLEYRHETNASMGMFVFD